MSESDNDGPGGSSVGDAQGNNEGGDSTGGNNSEGQGGSSTADNTGLGGYGAGAATGGESDTGNGDPLGLVDDDDDDFDWGQLALSVLGVALGIPPGLMAIGKIAFGGPKAAVGVAEDAIGQVIGKAIPGPLGMIAGKIAANYAGDQVEAGMLSGDPSNTSSPDGESLGGGGRSLAALSAQAAPSAARGQPQQQQQPTGLMNIPQFNYQQQLQKPDGMFTAPQFAYQQRSINA